MMLDQLFVVVKTLQMQEWIFVCLMIIFGAVVANFLISIHMHKNQGFVRFLSSIFSPKILLLSFIFCLLDFAFVMALYGWNLYAFFIACVLFLFYVMSCIDSFLLAIPNWLNFLCFFGIFAGLYYLGRLENGAFLSSFCAAGGLAILRTFGNFVFRKKILDEADITVFASMGTFLSIDWMIRMIILAFILVIGYILLLSVFALKGKEITPSKIKVPFAAFLSLAFVITLWCVEMEVKIV